MPLRRFFSSALASDCLIIIFSLSDSLYSSSLLLLFSFEILIFRPKLKYEQYQTFALNMRCIASIPNSSSFVHNYGILDATVSNLSYEKCIQIARSRPLLPWKKQLSVCRQKASFHSQKDPNFPPTG